MAAHKWEPCTTWRKFYWLWLKVAISHAWSLATLVGVALVLLLLLLGMLFPKMHESSLALLTWEIPIGLLAVVGFVRLLYASYWIYDDRHQMANDRESALISDVAARNETITALIAKSKRMSAD